MDLQKWRFFWCVQIAVSACPFWHKFVLVLACWNLTPRTRTALYYEAQLNSVMAYNIAKFCQKCQKLHIIFCLFRNLCCLFSLFLLALCPETYFWAIKNLLSRFETMLYPCGNTKWQPKLFPFFSASSRAQTGIMLIMTSDFLFSVQKCTEHTQPNHVRPQVALDQRSRDDGNMNKAITTQHREIFACYLCL